MIRIYEMDKLIVLCACPYSGCYNRVASSDTGLDFEIIVTLAEREGFEPSVRLPVQRFSSSKILVLSRAAT